MNALLFLIPVALLLGGLGLVAFLWSLKSNQYEDMQGAAYRILDDSDLDPEEQAKINASRKSDPAGKS
ncbi:cbb3-type cytochrome oxidase assembly protein CcoS [uncultured Cohaesibacter sp.]|uniref:cbb3-type cytochrome oxidase assembly protein CcoS n=1 Tax=uncultured Cohaesibacter sp. TaxID=1002546 RepID=UPI0029318154|nr:cbb3-type cytochrome oxidase assembly protein CcoS [uncultured Cohaesibacter sp.]